MELESFANIDSSRQSSILYQKRENEDDRSYEKEISAVKRKMRAIQKHRYFIKDYNRKVQEVMQSMQGVM